MFLLREEANKLVVTSCEELLIALHNFASKKTKLEIMRTFIVEIQKIQQNRDNRILCEEYCFGDDGWDTETYEEEDTKEMLEYLTMRRNSEQQFSPNQTLKNRNQILNLLQRAETKNQLRIVKKFAAKVRKIQKNCDEMYYIDYCDIILSD